MLKKRKLSVFLVMIVIFSFITFTLSGCSKTEGSSKYVNVDWQPLFRQIHSEQEYIL